MNTLKDTSYMLMAYALAEKAIGWTSPNPYVGAVIVKKDAIVGYGYHKKIGTPHAEAIALKRAGSLAKGSIAYITLEPCLHWGRTPPCVDMIINANLKRVVISSPDLNPLVYKKSIEKIRCAGIPLSLGLLENKNSQLNEIYIKYITQNKPFVIGKVAMSLDGKIATKTLDSQWISSPSEIEYSHLLRGEVDAIMVGINTLIKDDPLLTVRHPNWKDKRITRIILDTKLRFPLKAKMLDTLSKGRIIVFTLKNNSQKKADILRKKGVEVIVLTNSSSRIDLKEVLSWLGQHEISSILVEGGASLLTSFLEEKLLDKIFIILSPKLIGGRNAPTFFQGKGVNFIKDATNLKKIKTFHEDNGFILEGYF